MDELYDWAQDEDEQLGSAYSKMTRPTRRQDLVVPNISVAPTPYEPQRPFYPGWAFHGPTCRCHECDPRSAVPVINAAPAGAPLLDKVVALMVAFAGMIIGGLVLLPLILPLLTILLLFVVAGVAGLAILLGIVRAVTEQRPERPSRQVARRGRWR